MRQNSLSLWYLNNYIDEVKRNPKISGADNFDGFDIKVKITDDKGRYVHYLEVADFKRTLLIGAAGSGRTYVLKRIFRSNLCKSSKYFMYFDLRDYKGETLLDLICKRIKCRNITKGIIKNLIRDGEISFIFDNYDDLDYVNKNILNKKIISNYELENLKFIICAKDNINDIEFNKTFYIESFSTREVYKKVLRDYFDDYYDFRKFKSYLVNNKLECFIYKPINLNYLLKILESTKSLDFVYKLKSESSLYAKYIKETIKSKRIVNVLSYIAYYMIKRSYIDISGQELRILLAEALREFDKDIDIEKTLTKVKYKALEKSKVNEDTYRFKDKNVMMTLTYKYINDNKIKVKNIIHNEAFSEYFFWRCSIDEKFIYDNIFELDDEFLYSMLKQIECRKAEKFAPYIKLFFSDKPYDELMRKLNIIYQRFRWEGFVQDSTLNYLRDLNSDNNDVDRLMNTRLTSYVCDNENMREVYKAKKGRWLEESRKSELVRRVYVNIIKADYIEEYKIFKRIMKL